MVTILCIGPDGCSEELVGGMPVYSGLEVDILHSLAKYFNSLSGPLISAKLYDLHMAVTGANSFHL